MNADAQTAAPLLAWELDKEDTWRHALQRELSSFGKIGTFDREWRQERDLFGLWRDEAMASGVLCAVDEELPDLSSLGRWLRAFRLLRLCLDKTCRGRYGCRRSSIWICEGLLSDMGRFGREILARRNVLARKSDGAVDRGGRSRVEPTLREGLTVRHALCAKPKTLPLHGCKS